MIAIFSAMAYFLALFGTVVNINNKRWGSASAGIGLMIFAAIIFGSSI